MPSSPEPTDLPDAKAPQAPRQHIGDSERLALSVDEAAALLGISRSFAYDLVAAGDLPPLRLGRRIVIPRARSRAPARTRSGLIRCGRQLPGRQLPRDGVDGRCRVTVGRL